MTLRLLIASFVLLLAGCDIPGLGPDPRIAQREADARAIGAACRHALRGIEDCYLLNERASKTAVFDGWKEMDQYMRENKLEGQRPALAKNDQDEIIEVKKPAAPMKEKMAEDKPAPGDKSSAKSDKH